MGSQAQSRSLLSLTQLHSAAIFHNSCLEAKSGRTLCLHDIKGERDKVHALSTYYVPGIIRLGASLTRSNSLLNQSHEAGMIVSILQQK